jgi:hypothetical protein
VIQKEWKNTTFNNCHSITDNEDNYNDNGGINTILGFTETGLNNNLKPNHTILMMMMMMIILKFLN